MVAEPSVQVGPHRTERQGALPTPTPPPPAAVDAADRLQACAVRGRDRCARAHRSRWSRRRSSMRSSRPTTNRWSGPVEWTGRNPVKNVCTTPLVAGQWQRKDDKFDLVITTNKSAPEIPRGRDSRAADVRRGRRATAITTGSMTPILLELDEDLQALRRGGGGGQPRLSRSTRARRSACIGPERRRQDDHVQH